MADIYTQVMKFTFQDLVKFGEVSDDLNPIHFDKFYAQSQGYEDIIIHGALIISKVSGIISSTFPGPGTIIGTLKWVFLQPVFINQEVVYFCEDNDQPARKSLLEITIRDKSDKILQKGEITIFKPSSEAIVHDNV